jgi:hypothetical protein
MLPESSRSSGVISGVIATLRSGSETRSALRSMSCLIGICLLVIAPQCSVGQVTPGVPPFSTPDAHQYDTINLADLSVVITVPVRSKAAEPIPFSYSLQMDNYIFLDRKCYHDRHRARRLQPNYRWKWCWVQFTVFDLQQRNSNNVIH